MALSMFKFVNRCRKSDYKHTRQHQGGLAQGHDVGFCVFTCPSARAPPLSSLEFFFKTYTGLVIAFVSRSHVMSRVVSYYGGKGTL